VNSKKVLKAIIGESNFGRLEFFRKPKKRESWGGPFNGQKFRQRIFFDLLYYFPIKAVVETGTFRGTTTTMFVATSLPVYTVEAHPRYFSYSKTRFTFNRNIKQFKDDSRSFLKALSKDKSVPKEGVFFYLDAHWKEDLPLREELEIIFANWVRPIVMVDDFCVPDSNYEFDDYGPGKTLDMNYIKQVVSENNLSVFFPAVNAKEETGGKRGSVILCQDIDDMKMGNVMSTLVRYSC
jgi:hypothetical protein